MESLQSRLMKLRDELAHERGVQPTAIFSNPQIEGFARVRPVSLEDFEKCDGVSQAKRQYGPAFVGAIQSFVQENAQVIHNAEAAVEAEVRKEGGGAGAGYSSQFP